MFSVNKETALKAQNGSLTSDDLQLRQTTTTQGKKWEIVNKSEQTSSGGQVIAEGKELQKLFEEVANGQPISNTQLQDLSTIRDFRLFAKKLPNVETAAHRGAVQRSIKEKAVRVKAVLKEMGKGAAQLKKLHKPWRLLDTSYALSELLIKGATPIGDARRLGDLWKNSESTLSFQEWIAETKREWQAANSSLELLPWLTQREFEKSEKAAWQKEHPGEDFTETTFQQWKQMQYDPQSLVADPKWMLEKFWKEDCEKLKKQNKSEPSFDEWLKSDIKNRKEQLNHMPKNSGGIVDFSTPIDDATFKYIDKKLFDYFNLSGSPLDPDVWIAKEEWLATNPADRSEGAFREYIANRQYSFAQREAVQTGKTLPTFEQWKGERENRLQERYQATRCSLPYELWRAQQERDPLAPQPFVRLDADQRKAYQAECQNGALIRGGQPFSTEKESTAHSHEGWVIFVIGPQDDLYCASHLPGVFHHSSFLGDAAVMAGGEIKTNSSGQIVGLTSKSGHYKPTAEQNCAMLEWFRDRGCDLSKIDNYKYFTADGEKGPVNALDYLNARGQLP